MAKPLEFWFEFASSYSFPAAMKIEDACREAGVPLRWRPFLLGPVFAAQGLNDSPFNLFPVKGAYMWKDLARICADGGISYNQPTQFPRGSLLAARIAARFQEADWIGSFIRAVYHANFSQDRDVSNDAVIADILAELGQDPASVCAAATTQEAKDLLRSQTAEAQARGVFGAPTLIVGDELFWGHDRVDQAIRWAIKP